MDGASTVKLHGGSSGDAGDERGDRKGDDTPGATGDFGDKDPTGWIPASKLQKRKKTEYTYIIKRKKEKREKRKKHNEHTNTWLKVNPDYISQGYT